MILISLFSVVWTFFLLFYKYNIVLFFYCHCLVRMFVLLLLPTAWLSAWHFDKKYIKWRNKIVVFIYSITLYRGANKSLARPGRKQANVSIRMTWNSFGALLCGGRKTWWQLASRCCWNRARPWHASELVSSLVGLKTYQQSGSLLQYATRLQFGISLREEESWAFTIYCTFTLVSLAL